MHATSDVRVEPASEPPPMIPATAAGKALAALALILMGKHQWNAKQRRTSIHQAFMAFSDRIKHEQFEERELLRERRELLTERLFKALPPEPEARLFTQGSYAMQTGVKPLDGEYDIDIGLAFNCGVNRFAGPVQAKQLVRDALVQGSRRVKIRRSCVTVYYKGSSGLPDYHVDIAVYAQGTNGQLMLAKGRERSSPKNCFWEASQPEQLTAQVIGKFSGEQVAQFRRCVRYLKRWKHVNFHSPAPHSIALTLAAYHWFRPNTQQWLDTLDDREALLTLVRSMLNYFQDGRLSVKLPSPQKIDILKPMTSKQMNDFKEKLQKLEVALEIAGQQTPIEAVSMLAEQFGSDFF